MAIREIILFPASILHQKAKPVKEVDNEVCSLLDDMIETMRAHTGVGLAAPQVGISLRAIVVDGPSIEPKGKRPFWKMINPELVEQSGEIEWNEGCLSVPDFRIDMKRKQRVVCSYLDEEGREQQIKVSDLFAVVLQHEIDHLNGKLIIDSVSRMKQDLYLQKLKKQRS